MGAGGSPGADGWPKLGAHQGPRLVAVKSVRVKVGERWYTVEVEDLSTSPIKVTVDGETVYVEVEGLPRAGSTPRRPTQPRQPRSAPPQARPSPSGGGPENIILSPMPGRVVAVKVVAGDNVTSGQELCVVEAMKMEQSIRAHRPGVVKAVHIQPMDQVRAEQPLVELE